MGTYADCVIVCGPFMFTTTMELCDLVRGPSAANNQAPISLEPEISQRMKRFSSPQNTEATF
jgi:hypothetical protein